MTPVERAAALLQEARALCDHITEHADESLDVDGMVALWRDTKEAANRLYQTCKTLEPNIIKTDPDSRGWHNGGRPVEVKRRFEVELLNHEEFAGWLAGQDDNRAEVEWSPRLNRDARDLVRRAVVEDGEIPAGVSAGYGNPFLSLGR